MDYWKWKKKRRKEETKNSNQKICEQKYEKLKKEYRVVEFDFIMNQESQKTLDYENSNSEIDLNDAELLKDFHNPINREEENEFYSLLESDSLDSLYKEESDENSDSSDSSYEESKRRTKERKTIKNKPDEEKNYENSKFELDTASNGKSEAQKIKSFYRQKILIALFILLYFNCSSIANCLFQNFPVFISRFYVSAYLLILNYDQY